MLSLGGHGTPRAPPHLAQVTVVSVVPASVSLAEQEGRHILPWRAPRYRRPSLRLFREVQLARQLHAAGRRACMRERARVCV